MLASEESKRVRDYMRRGVVHLENVAPRFHALAGDMLTERDGLEPAAARADIEGYLTDLIEAARAPGRLSLEVAWVSFGDVPSGRPRRLPRVAPSRRLRPTTAHQGW